MNRAESGAGQLPIAGALLPLAYVLHLGEEIWTDLLLWTGETLGRAIPLDRFIAINATALVLFIVGTVAAYRFHRAGWFPVALAATLAANGALHLLAAMAFGGYAPGMITGTVLSLPLGVLVLRSSRAQLSQSIFVRAVVAGLAFHALVSAVAFA
ncbi:MAG: HXXEE domain-containing protein [Rhodothermales bacterium]|nr:HXXEE domain-containing protein [Rhodothermales bacterium]